MAPPDERLAVPPPRPTRFALEGRVGARMRPDPAPALEPRFGVTALFRPLRGRIEARALPLTNRTARLRDAAISRCGPGAERSMIEVDVTLPAEAQPTTGPGPLRYLVYREGGEWTIWSPT